MSGKDQADTGTTAPVTTPAAPPVELPSDQPELLAGKYKTTEELVKGYKELEKKLGQKAPAGEQPTSVKPKTALPPITDAEAQQAAGIAGLDMAKLNAEYETNGALSDESIQALAKVGIPKQMVEDYIAGQEARAAQSVAQVYQVAGGEDQYKAAIAWAGANLPKEDVAAFNKAITGDFNQQRFAVEALMGRFKAARGSAPNLLQGQAAPTGPVGYASQEQMRADMRDPRYKRDPAFRAAVMEKARNTTAF